jgi:1-acyl-sn-glycerol-3-phosphate acyltransferase
VLSLACVAGLFSRAASHELFRVWSRALLAVQGISFLVEDRAPDIAHKPCLYVLLNQTSILEICYWALALPRGFFGVMNIEYALLPWIGWATRARGGVVIVRQWSWHARRGIAIAERQLRHRDVAISIEGRRSESGALSPYKKGPVVMALNTHAPIRPIVFHGAFERLPVGAWRVRPGRVRVALLEPIETEGLGHDDRHRLVERLHDIAERELFELATRDS